MAVTDPIADMLTRIRNAAANRDKQVQCLNSKVCQGIARILQEEGYIDGFDVLDLPPQGAIRVRMKYGPRGEEILHHIKRESRPGRRVYRRYVELDRPLEGLGISIVSTSRGVMSDRKCRDQKIGGELLATVY
jgi:small subunit ribosomal protein S8